MFRHCFKRYKRIMLMNVFQQAVNETVVFKKKHMEFTDSKLVLVTNSFKLNNSKLIHDLLDNDNYSEDICKSIGEIERNPKIHCYNKNFLVTNIFKNIDGIDSNLLEQTGIIRIHYCHDLLIEYRKDTLSDDDLTGYIDINDYRENLGRIVAIKSSIVAIHILLLAAIFW